MRSFVRFTVPAFSSMPGHQRTRQFTSPARRDTRAPPGKTAPTGCIFENQTKHTPCSVWIQGSPEGSQNTSSPRPERKPYSTCMKTAPESISGPLSARPSLTWVSNPGVNSPNTAPESPQIENRSNQTTPGLGTQNRASEVLCAAA